MKIITTVSFSILSWMLISTNTACAQSNQSDDLLKYKKYAVKTEIGKTQTDINQDSTIFETTYLGTLIMHEGDIHSNVVTYHFLSQFVSVQAAISRHGHSKIIVLNNAYETVRTYELSMPDELPSAIDSGFLVFKEGRMSYFALPELICIPKGSCY